MRIQKYLLIPIIISLFFLSHANALLISGPDIISAPADVSDDAATNTAQQAFNEVQNYTLVANLNVDGGFISAGTIINSHMIFLNTVGTSLVTDQQTWGFDGLILGVMSDSRGQLEANSSSFLGAAGTTYPGAFNARGLEGDPLDGLTNDDWYSVTGNDIEVFMRVTEPGDWIRVVTAPVPEPGTLLLLGSGLAGLALYRRRMNKA